MQITVKSVEPKQSKDGKAFQKITDSAGNWYSLWDSNLFGTMEVGKSYEINYEASGKYKNIIEVKIAASQPATQPAGNGQTSADKDTLIPREVALKSAVEFAGYKIQAGIDIDSAGVIQVARLYEKYILTG